MTAKIKELKKHIYKISGNTYPFNKELKNYGAVWNSFLKCWYLKADEDHPIIWANKRTPVFKAEILENNGLEYHQYIDERYSNTWSTGCFV